MGILLPLLPWCFHASKPEHYGADKVLTTTIWTCKATIVHASTYCKEVAYTPHLSLLLLLP
jgi:hypothetical protein